MSATVYPEQRRPSAPTTGPRRFGTALRGMALGAILLLAPSCLSLIPIEQDVALGVDAYSQLLAEGTPTVESGPQVEMVERVTGRLVAAAVEREPEFGSFPWEVTLLDAPTVNAFCLPGGKMAVYTGILSYTEDEGGLAVVMGHEIAHATERHGIEKVRNVSFQQGVVVVAEAYEVDPVLLETLQSAADVLLHLPYGRSQELEADRIGLFTMAAAGYDPREAVAFWKRMAQAAGEKPPEFLSTHPSDETRIAQLEELMPKALQVYEQALAAGSTRP